jgi:tetratricopeptide (TPR) repeat protein
VAKRPKFPSTRLSEADIAARIRRAESEGRFQQALELAKSLYKQAPSPQHKELLQRMVLGRVRQLRLQGHLRDAQTALENALQLDAGPAWLEQLAQEMAACGLGLRALELLRGFPDSPALPRVLGQAADAAIAQGMTGRAQLPQAVQDQFDLVLQAFSQVQAGQDEEARATLQGIGLSSPFLEWKLFLRGLIAYYQDSDPRALENWQRLKLDRLPARLAAPLRLGIDAGFRLAQPPATQASLQQQADRLQNSGLVQPLRAIQASLASEDKMPQAFRLAENLLPALRQEAPHLVPRLASCFYWSVINSGRPEDLPRYQRVFGAPADDPTFDKLHALALEHRENFVEAHKAWQYFEKQVAKAPAAWPGDQARRVRALVWHHMGTNAASVPDKQEMAKLPRFMRDDFFQPRPLSPPADKCFERSLALAPDQLETYQAYFEYLRRKKKTVQALKIGRRLLKHFPDHVPTLRALGELCLDHKDFAEGLSLLQRALQANPLERRLRGMVSHAHILNARQFAEKDQFDEARNEYRAAQALADGKKEVSLLCKWAACEFKAGALEQAESLIQQALSDEGSRLAVAYCLLIETIRFKLARPLKTRFDKDFKEALAEIPTGSSSARVADIAAAHRLAGINYFGQKTHEKKVMGYLEKSLQAEFSEDQLAKVCAGLSALKASRSEMRFLHMGQTRFPHSPVFYLAEAEHYLTKGPDRCPMWQVRQLLDRARELANAMPRDDRQHQILEVIKQHQELMSLLNPMGRMPSSHLIEDLFDEMYCDEGEFEDEDIF